MIAYASLRLYVARLFTPTRHYFLYLQDIHDAVLRLILNDLPGLLFFTTYTLLVLFWAEIYHQAKGQSTAKLRPTFLVTNIFVYAVQVTLLISSAYQPFYKASVVWHHPVLHIGQSGHH